MSDDTQRVAAAWGRIEAWLGEHAAASAGLLRPPAGEADIAAAEMAMGVEFPAALAAWYRLCDGFGEGHGCGILPSGMAMLPLADLVDEYRMRTRDWVRSLGLVSVVVRVGGGVLGLGCVWAGQWWFVGGWVAVMR